MSEADSRWLASQVRAGSSTAIVTTRRTSCFSRHFDVCYCIWSSPSWRSSPSPFDLQGWWERWPCPHLAQEQTELDRSLLELTLSHPRRDRIPVSCFPAWGACCWTTLLVQMRRSLWSCLCWSENADGKTSESQSWKESEPIGRESLQHLGSLFRLGSSWEIWHVF